MSGRLDDLVRLYGVQRTYQDAFGRERTAPEEATRALLQGLGADTSNLVAAMTERRRELAARTVEPVAVAWEGRLDLPVRSAAATEAVEWHLALEDGGERSGRLHPRPAPDGTAVLSFPDDLPLGYHELRLTLAGAEHRTLVIAAPKVTYGGEIHRRRTWGTFLPLYAARSEASWGVGDLGDLERLAAHTRSKGGSVIGTLPLYAAFLGGGRRRTSPSTRARTPRRAGCSGTRSISTCIRRRAPGRSWSACGPPTRWTTGA